MNSIQIFIIIGIVAWILNFSFGLIQIRNFNKNYIELKRLGKVAIGRKKGFILSGVIVLIRIDNRGNIIESRKMQGVTVTARVKSFNGLENKNIGEITKADLKKFNKPLKCAILDASKNYAAFNKRKEEENAPNDVKETEQVLLNI